MFADKKDADAHDRLLEATEDVAAVLESMGGEMDAERAYQIAQTLVAHREDVMAALKKAPKMDKAEPARPAETTEEQAEETPQAARPRKTGKSRTA